MNNQLRKVLIDRYSRQIVLKDIGTIGQKKIISAKVLIVGMGGLGVSCCRISCKSWRWFDRNS